MPATTHARQPPTCPNCGSTDTIEIVYGLPSSELVEQYLRGEIVLGSCCIDVDENGERREPARHCRACTTGFGKITEG